MKRSVGPLSTAPRTSGETATTGASVARSASAIPPTARIGPIEITGFDGPIRTARARRDRVEHLRRRRRRAGAEHLDALDRPRAPLADHELLEAEPAPRARTCVRTGGVGRRQHARRARRAPARAPSSVSVSRAPSAEPSRALEADREVAVAEVEPDLVAELAERLHDREGVVPQPQPRSSMRSASQ